MILNITIDTSELTEAQGQQLIEMVFGGAIKSAPAPSKGTTEKTAPAKTPAKTAASKPAPAPAEESDDEGDDAPELTVDDALKAASALVSAGKSAKVKEALASVGAKRVSEISKDRLAEFLGALN